MTLFAIFEPKPGTARATAAIAEKFSWAAFLLPPVWATAHGLWLELIAYLVVVIALGFAALWLGTAASVWLYGLLALWIGFAAPSLRRTGLRLRGWRYRRIIVAPAADLATLSWLEAK